MSPSTLYIIFQSDVQILLKLNVFLGSFDFLILIFLKLLTIDESFPLNLLLLVNICLLSLYCTNITATGLFLLLSGTSVLWVLSMFPGDIWKSISLLIKLITTFSMAPLLLSSKQCMRTQFLLEYGSCLSTRDNIFSPFSV